MLTGSLVSLLNGGAPSGRSSVMFLSNASAKMLRSGRRLCACRMRIRSACLAHHYILSKFQVCAFSSCLHILFCSYIYITPFGPYNVRLHERKHLML